MRIRVTTARSIQQSLIYPNRPSFSVSPLLRGLAPRVLVVGLVLGGAGIAVLGDGRVGPQGSYGRETQRSASSDVKPGEVQDARDLVAVEVSLITKRSVLMRA